MYNLSLKTSEKGPGKWLKKKGREKRELDDGEKAQRAKKGNDKGGKA